MKNNIKKIIVLCISIIIFNVTNVYGGIAIDSDTIEGLKYAINKGNYALSNFYFCGTVIFWIINLVYGTIILFHRKQEKKIDLSKKYLRVLGYVLYLIFSFNLISQLFRLFNYQNHEYYYLIFKVLVVTLIISTIIMLLSVFLRKKSKKLSNVFMIISVLIMIFAIKWLRSW